MATSGAIHGAPSIRCRATRWPPASTTANARFRPWLRASSSPLAMRSVASASFMGPDPILERMRLSVLDQSPIAEGSTGAQALHNTIDLAQLADALGYTRYWVAE